MLHLKDTGNRPKRGRFHLEIRRSGQLIEVIDEENLIVDVSKYLHAQLLGGAVTNNSVTTIGFGTNLTTPAAGNTTLTGAFTKAVDGVTYPATNEVCFAFSLLSTEANGIAIGEFGLLTGGGSLYARKVRAAALPKESDLSLSGTWIIEF